MTTSESRIDCSNGWDAIACKFISIATWDIGASTVANWANYLKPGQSVVDVGCGFGGTYTQLLLDNGIRVFGIDPSKTLIREHQKRFPDVVVRCESAEQSSFFDDKFDGVLSVGLIFLLSPDDQISVLQKMAAALKEGGKLLFTSPYQVCEWDDLLTGNKSHSLGRERYTNILKKHGLNLVNEYSDEGQNHYFDFQRQSIR